jgi:hypothetical protein
MEMEMETAATVTMRTVENGESGGVVNGVLLPSIALNCLPGCCTRIFNCSGILD